MRRLALIAAVLSALSLPAVAQDGSEVLVERTPAGANIFLNEFLRESGSRVSVFAFYPNRWVRSDRARFQNWRFPNDGESFQSTNWGTVVGSFVGVTQPQNCVSHFQLTDFRYRGTTGGGVDPYDLSVSRPGETREYALKWSKVTLIHVNPVRMNLANYLPFGMAMFTVDGQLIQFEFRTVEDANRAKFAMEFLKAACVPRSTTGF